jgi:hypothetical protein
VGGDLDVVPESEPLDPPESQPIPSDDDDVEVRVIAPPSPGEKRTFKWGTGRAYWSKLHMIMEAVFETCA